MRLGTRGSALARVQAEWVAAQIRGSGFDVEIVVVRTAADRAPQLALSAIGDKGLWVADLEQQLLSNEIDLAVHSMKDVPAALAPGLTLGAAPERECPLDALVLPAGAGSVDPRLADPKYAASAINYPYVALELDRLLPKGARVGTSSARRKGQLLLWRPDLKILPVRGNVDTRICKLDDGEWDALVLAAAGLRRLGRQDRIAALFPARRLIPAAGQGALALEIRDDDEMMKVILTPLNHDMTAAAVAAERSFVRTVGGGCSVPLGVYSSFPPGCLELWIRAVAPEPGAGAPLQDLQLVEIPEGPHPFQDLGWAVECGRSMGRRFLENGGAEFLSKMRSAD